MEKCKFEKINKCQPKGSAGHTEGLKSIKKDYCAKKLDSIKDRELHFYRRNCGSRKKRKICKFSPKYVGICRDNKILYVKIENLRKNMLDPWTMDIKIGTVTASRKGLRGKRKLSLKKKLGIKVHKSRHIILDNITTSKKYGFRVESIIGDVKRKKMSIMRASPYKNFSIFFKSVNVLNKVIRKLKEIYKFVKSSAFDEYSFVGSSILIVYDYSKKDRRLSEGDVRVAIIDFKNYRQSKRITNNERKYRKNFREGLKNLIDLLVRYSKSI